MLLMGSTYAANSKHIKANSSQQLSKNAFLEICGTGSVTISSDCWEATYTVTVCGDFGSQAEADLTASLMAGKKKNH